MAKTLPLDHEAFRTFFDPMTGDRCLRRSIVDIHDDVKPMGPVGFVRLEYISRGIGNRWVTTETVIVAVADVADGSVWREEFRLDLLEHGTAFSHRAHCLGVTPQRLADLIRANAPR